MPGPAPYDDPEFVAQFQRLFGVTPDEASALIKKRVAGLGSPITCPVCGRTSYNPNDVSEGYCGNCHAYTKEEASHG